MASETTQQPSGRPWDRRTAAWQRFITAFHTWIYKLSGGRLGARLVGAPVVLLMTIGRRSGQLRTTPLIYLRDNDHLVLVASNGGTLSDPGWWHNLQENPNALIQLGRSIISVQARRADATERARLWPLVTQMYSGYAEYQQRTPREIPLVIVQPLNSSELPPAQP